MKLLNVSVTKVITINFKKFNLKINYFIDNDYFDFKKFYLII